jgi:Family of unknown function (DUF5691)
MSTWHDLVTASLIGTERAVVPAVGIPGLLPVAPADNDIRGPADNDIRGPADNDIGTPADDDTGAPADHDAGDPAAVLLDRAALLTAARRAGRRPDRAEPLPVAEPDLRPEVSPAAAARLARMLGGEHVDLLIEWLRAAMVRGLRPPSWLLPALLDRARGDWPLDPVLPSLVAAAGGPNARWLAGLNPDWGFAAAAPQTVAVGEEAWRSGKILQRRGYLASLLAREPAAARQLISSSWEAHPRERYMFLMVLSDGLSPADEPLLETALDDPDMQVRRLAGYLLAGLPESPLALRMAERAVRCLRIELQAGRERLAVRPPAECDAAMQRDGVESYPHLRRRPPTAAQVADRQAVWIIELIARTPLRTWTDAFGRTPAQIVGMPIEGWAHMVIVGWMRAAIAQRDQAWAGALIHRAIAGLPRPVGDLSSLARQADPALGAPGALAEPRTGTPPTVWGMKNLLRFRYEMLKELDDDRHHG